VEPVLIAIVIAILAGVVLLVIEYRTKWFAKSLSARDRESPTEVRDTPPTSSRGYREHPSPREVIEEIEKLPPFQRETAEEHYTGLRVKWRTAYLDVLRKEGNRATLVMRDESHVYPAIVCEIDTSEYPEARTAKSGHKVWVSGEIARVDGHTIYLSSSTAVFD
jgi:hypothetical protein